MKFSGVKILQGVEISIFLLIFEWALQQCSATALPVIRLVLECIHIHVAFIDVHAFHMYTLSSHESTFVHDLISCQYYCILVVYIFLLLTRGR